MLFRFKSTIPLYLFLLNDFTKLKFLENFKCHVKGNLFNVIQSAIMFWFLYSAGPLSTWFLVCVWETRSNNY